MQNLTGLSILIVGLGNPILGDDGVGWRVAERIQARLSASPALPSQVPITVECFSLGGLSLMEQLVDYTYVIIIDAINSDHQSPGTVTVFKLEDLPDNAVGHLGSAHDTSLQNALQVGRSMGACLPGEITIVGIESPFVYDFSEQLTPPVAAAVPQAEEQVIALLNQRIRPYGMAFK
jgi:hydrogenase maturation protease